MFHDHITQYLPIPHWYTGGYKSLQTLVNKGFISSLTLASGRIWGFYTLRSTLLLYIPL